MHPASVTGCLGSPGDGPQRRQEVRTFGTTTLRRADILDGHLSEDVEGSSAPVDGVEASQALRCLLLPSSPVTMPGVSRTAAQILVAEIGTDMSRFPSAGHLISWAGLCPRQDASAGKHRSTRLRKGAPRLKPVLVQGAWAAVRGREGYLRAQFLRLKPRRGPMKAIVAVAASMLTAAYVMLRDGTDYHDLGAAHFQRGDHARLVAGLPRRLHQLGYEVTLHPAA